MKKYIFLHLQNMAIIAQLVRVPDCGSEGRGFETHWSPKQIKSSFLAAFLILKLCIFAPVKMNNKYLALLLITVLFCACNKKQLTPKPGNLIPFDKMVNVMAESYVIESMIYYLPPDSDKTIITKSLYSDLFTKNKISKDQFNSSIKYYLAEKSSAERILKAVSNKIDQKRKLYVTEPEKNEEDDSPNR